MRAPYDIASTTIFNNRDQGIQMIVWLLVSAISVVRYADGNGKKGTQILVKFQLQSQLWFYQV